MEVIDGHNRKFKVEGVAVSRKILHDQILEVKEIGSRSQSSEDSLFIVERDGILNKLSLISNLSRQPQIDIDLVRLSINPKVAFSGQSERHVVLSVGEINVVIALDVSSSVNSKMGNAV